MKDVLMIYWGVNENKVTGRVVDQPSETGV